MSKILVFGHQNPDTDAIGAAIAFSHLQNELGKETEAVALGTPNEETQYALDHFQLSAPRVVESAKAENADVMLVDHNEFQQSISDISEVNILAVVDHHRIANFETANPLYYRAEPVGCTSTIILKLYKENQVTILKKSQESCSQLSFQIHCCSNHQHVRLKMKQLQKNLQQSLKLI